jgi:hypothetical protein
MLRRGKSRSSNYISRQKSTSSAYSKQEYNDPEIAHQYAQAAATYAFVQARARENADTGRRAGQLKHNNTIMGDSQFLQQNSETDQKDRVRRQPSVRFAGPRAVTSRRSIGLRAVQHQRLTPKASTASLRPRALTNDDPVPAAYRPPSRSSSIGKASMGKRRAESVVTALAYDEYYTREDDVASTPSSYRRIRKSKSMLSPRKAPSIFFNNGTPESDYTFRTQDRSLRSLGEQQQQLSLRAPRSMSFVGRGKGHATTVAREQNDATVQMARDKFLHQVEQQRLRAQPSFIFRSRAKREEKPFRKSVRTSSSNSYGTPIASLSQQPKEGSLREKTRRASQNIKNKLKSLFRRNGGDSEETVIPDQQVEAHKPHDCGFTSTAHPMHQNFVGIPCPDSATMSRVVMRQLPIHPTLSSQHLRSRTTSIQSLRSDASGKSRVTSWTSNVENTSNGRHTQGEREQQRLSIIQETGTHISSSTFARPALANQFSPYPAFHRPRSSNSHPPPVATAVDSQGVYSALMKRLDENSPKAKLAQRMASAESFGPVGYTPARIDSANSPRCPAPSTIRHVLREASNSSTIGRVYEEAITSPPLERDDVFSPQPPPGANSSLGLCRGHSSSSARTVIVSREPSYSAYPPLQAEGEIGLTPQQQAEHNEVLNQPAHGLLETRSTFFGNSTVTTRRTTSPYRRALAGSDYNPVTITRDVTNKPPPSKLSTVPVISDPLSTVSLECATQDRRNTVYSESVYSRTTSGQTPVAAHSNASLAPAADDVSPGLVGSVVLVEQATYRSTPAARRLGSSEGSDDWRNFLSSQVSILEKAKETDGTTKINYALPSMPKAFGHIRERAQITDEDSEIAQRKVSQPKQPLGLVQQNAQQPPLLKPILKNKSTTSLVEVPPPPPPPPMPPLMPLRPAISRSSLRSTTTEKTASASASAIKLAATNGSQLLRTRSNSTLRSINTPAKLVKRSGRPSTGKYSPGSSIGAAVEKQFGSTGSRTQYSGTENHSPANVAVDELYGSDGAGILDSERHLSPQAMGSKHMVDMFLSSRRRRVAGSDESNAFL